MEGRFTVEQARELFGNEFCRLSAENNFDFENVFFVGNGAVNQGAQPLEKWLAELQDAAGQTFRHKLTYDTHLSWLAVLFKMFRGLVSAQRQKFEPQIQKLLAEKDTLGRIYRQASCSSQISLRELPADVLDVLCSERTLIVTLNWDLCLWLEAKFKSVVQLHGTCLRPRSMIFPSEFVIDLLPRKSGDRDEVPFDIPSDDLYALGQCHRLTISALTKCRAIYFWGVALNTYDSEIMNVLSLSCDAVHQRKLVVINPYPDSGVRAASFLQLEHFTHINPDDGFSLRVLSESNMR